MNLREFIEAGRELIVHTANENATSNTSDEQTKLIWALQRLARAAWHYRAALTHESAVHRDTLRRTAERGLEDATALHAMDSTKAPPAPGLDYPFAETFERAMESSRPWAVRQRQATCRFCDKTGPEGRARCEGCGRTLWKLPRP